MMKHILHVMVTLTFVFGLYACGGGGGGGSTGNADSGSCVQVSQGNSTVKVVNASGSMIQVYFGSQVGFGADLAPGECNLVGIQLPSSYTLQTQVEITQCTPASGGGCGPLFGSTKYVALTLPTGQTQTIIVDSNFFNSGGGNTYSISGTVTTSGVGLSGVTITLTGTGTGYATTDAYGNYTLTGISNGTYSVTPSKSGYTFSPGSTSVTLNGVNQTGKNFTATAISSTYSISGTVTYNGSGLSGVTITLSGAGLGTATTDSSGNYTITGIANGTYTVTPSKSSYTFTPFSASVTVSGTNVYGNNFIATTTTASYTVSGTVSGAVASGVTVNLSGSANASTITDASGNYTFTGLATGTYTVTPSLPGYAFTPTYTSITIINTNSTGINFVSVVSLPSLGLVAYYPFSGNANDMSGNGYNGTVNGATLTTDRFGNANSAYAFNGINNYIKVSTQSFKLLSRTIAFWIKTGQNSPATLLTYEDGNALYGWDLYRDTYALEYAVVSSAGGTTASANSAAVITDNSWNFVVGTDDGLSLNLYINGTLVSTVTSANPQWATSMNLYLGATQPENIGSLWFNGALDDLRIYNRVLSANEIQQLYNEDGYPSTKAKSWDMVTEFSTVNNPSGQWSYGRKWALGDLNLDVSNQLYGGTMWWFGNYGTGWPSVFTWGAWVNMWAGNNTNGYPTVRWTCPKSGYYTMTGAFIGYDSRAQGVGNNVYVIVNGGTSFTAHVQTYLEKDLISLGRSYFNQNDTIDFLNMWDGIAYYGYGVVGVSARVTETQ